VFNNDFVDDLEISSLEQLSVGHGSNTVGKE